MQHPVLLHQYFEKLKMLYAQFLSGGICGACVAKVVKGSTDASDIPDLEFTVSESRLFLSAWPCHLLSSTTTLLDALSLQVSADEQAAGMVLLCMSRATADLEV